jgi:hypothetical protein
LQDHVAVIAKVKTRLRGCAPSCTASLVEASFDPQQLSSDAANTPLNVMVGLVPTTHRSACPQRKFMLRQSNN